MTKEKFDKWYAESAKPVIAAGAAPGAVGEAIMKAQGCFACHTTDGSKLIGPSYLNLFGSQQVVVRDGKEMTITVDAAYVKESILEPGADVTKGYPNGLMQSYRNTVSDDDINKIVEYLKTLNDK
jgi:cytochrome c oxidase subunit 2